ncbi:vacuolar protein sorting/targeting protein 10 [Pleurotus eryngii]|uniref:Vacuolar protein sorting/targeting protein 10 n=1 Tax=Pleurotus eryngii TaxID=5323 RepID=A0A9P6DII4_PLEER|nr:vacuolar protein sorting/targeting protein 10 [Pleurotus eryngii]
MITRHWVSSLALLWCFCFALAQKPSHTITPFRNLPGGLFFFEDTQAVLYFDAIDGIVYVSSDEGKGWEQAQGVPKGVAKMIVPHPFNNHYAFILTNDKKHYRTADRGKSWQSFEMPAELALVSKPLSFHSDPAKYGYILYQGVVCERKGWAAKCHDETYYTTDAFSSDAKLLLKETSQCQFAHSSKDFKHEAHSDLVYCVAFDTSAHGHGHSLSSSRLFSTADFGATAPKMEDLGIGREAKGVIAFAIVSKYAVVALRDLSSGNGGEMHLYVTVDTKTWAKARFPHASSAQLRENAYTMLESTTHSLAVDVVLQDKGAIGTLFVSNSNGTFFVESLKNTNRNDMGFVDYEKIYGVDGVGISNIVVNAQEVEGRNVRKEIKSVITFDDGRTWQPIRAPRSDDEGNRIKCDPSNSDECSIHFHSVTNPHNFGRVFSSPAPGIVMGVGSIGPRLLSYEECDTFVSTDAGVSWKMVRKDAHKYEIGDSGSILVAVNDEEGVDKVTYSTDLGKSWYDMQEYDLGLRFRARALTTAPDSTSQKFILLAQIAKKDQTSETGRFAVIFLDFADTRKRQCTERDFEKWYARTSKDNECIMGHKQWYKRRKPDADCYVGDKFNDPVEHEENCNCGNDDFECDYNYIRNGDTCEPAGPEPIPAGVCTTGDPDQTYWGSSGWTKIPGNTCVGGSKKDEKVEKKCAQAQPPEGDITHQTFEFPAAIVQHAYFKDSTVRRLETILVRLSDHSIWQSSNEGYTWTRLFENERFLAFYHHTYSNDRAYLITNTNKFFYTTDTGRTWNVLTAPTAPNTFHAQVLRFQPKSDYLIWTGDVDCDGSKCRAQAQYSTDNGRKWNYVDEYVRNCAWAMDAALHTDPKQILCESYKDKKGSQRFFNQENPLQLVGGARFYKDRKVLFEHVVGFAKFSEFLVVAELMEGKNTLELQVSLDGVRFATGRFPSNMHPDTHAYTVLESSTNSLFLHMTMSEPPSPYWGSILKSNSNGTYFGLAMENVNRDDRGYVDFEKMIGLDGIALINVVGNAKEAPVSGRKSLQSRITHNDGGTWKPLVPPQKDSLGRPYGCDTTKCALHIHGYTERADPRTTYSTPSTVGLLMAVGNVGEHLETYTESDTFLSRDAGFTWEEVHKDAHLWEFGDSGSVLIMANDEEPTEHVLFSTDEGLNWREYKFTDDKMRVRAIVTVPSDTSRKFILFGQHPRSSNSVAVQIDFSSLTLKQCVLNVEDPGKDDFELWSPSEERQERCLFGRQTLYHRRVRDVNCVVGKQPKVASRVVKNCECTRSDFECEFNHIKDANDNCVLVPGTEPLPNDESCSDDSGYWYDRTAYRKIPYSTCEGGQRLDRGSEHICPGFSGHSWFFWLFMLTLPFGFTALVAYYYYRRSGLARGTIRLPGDGAYRGRDSGVLDTLASVPWFVLGLVGIAWEWVSSRFESTATNLRNRRGYRNIPIDEDAQVLRFEDED